MPDDLTTPDRPGGTALSVATYNLYQGAGLIRTYGSETVREMAEALGDAYGKMAKSDFPARAAAIARLLAGHEPAVIGLQEVALWERGPGDAVDDRERCDFLTILLDELAATGLRYRPVAVNRVSTVAFQPDDRISFTDRLALLVRADLSADRLRVTGYGHQLFTDRFDVPSQPGVVFEKVRGWCWADLEVAGQPVRFVTTHLEAFTAEVRAAQAAELSDLLSDCPYPVVVAGDFNSAPDEPDGPYQVLSAAGYADAWSALRGADDGYTGEQPASLDNEESELYHRVDHIRYRGLTADSIALLGVDPADRLPGGQWPSDHAGLAATLRFPARH